VRGVLIAASVVVAIGLLVLVGPWREPPSEPGGEPPPANAERSDGDALRGGARGSAETALPRAAGDPAGDRPGAREAAPSPDASPVRGRVVDAGSGEGLAEVRVELAVRSGRSLETVETDSTGAFLSRRALPHGPILAKLRDAQTGEAVEDFWLLLRIEGRDDCLYEWGSFGSPDVEVLEDEHFEWVLLAEGFRAASGTQAAFGFVEGEPTARIELSPGWCCAIEARDASALLSGWLAVIDVSDLLSSDDARLLSCPPLVGASVLAGGARLARTGARGQALVSLEGPPKDLRLELPGWGFFACPQLGVRGELPGGELIRVFLVPE